LELAQTFVTKRGVDDIERRMPAARVIW
jgi:hypothetical protein